MKQYGRRRQTNYQSNANDTKSALTSTQTEKNNNIVMQNNTIVT